MRNFRIKDYHCQSIVYSTMAEDSLCKSCVTRLSTRPRGHNLNPSARTCAANSPSRLRHDSNLASLYSNSSDEANSINSGCQRLRMIGFFSRIAAVVNLHRFFHWKISLSHALSRAGMTCREQVREQCHPNFGLDQKRGQHCPNHDHFIETSEEKLGSTNHWPPQMLLKGAAYER